MCGKASFAIDIKRKIPNLKALQLQHYFGPVDVTSWVKIGRN